MSLRILIERYNSYLPKLMLGETSNERLFWVNKINETKEKSILYFEGKKQQIGFLHNYYKLCDNIFSTIRGRTYPKSHDLREGDYVLIRKEKQPIGIAKVQAIYYREIRELDIDFLKKDGEYNGFTINSHKEFIELLNSFWKWVEVSETTRVSIIVLSWECRF